MLKGLHNRRRRPVGNHQRIKSEYFELGSAKMMFGAQKYATVFVRSLGSRVHEELFLTFARGFASMERYARWSVFREEWFC